MFNGPVANAMRECAPHLPSDPSLLRIHAGLAVDAVGAPYPRDAYKPHTQHGLSKENAPRGRGVVNSTYLNRTPDVLRT
jgi:hypothetical protein